MLLSEFIGFPRIRIVKPGYANKLAVGRKAIATTKTRVANINKNIVPNSMADGMTSVVKRGNYRMSTNSPVATYKPPKPITPIKATRATPKAARTSLQQYRLNQQNKYG